MQAAAIMNRIRRLARSDETLRVTPREPLLASQAPDGVLDAPLPALLKAYIRLGAKACGEPCRDADFGVADVLMPITSLGSTSPSSAHRATCASLPRPTSACGL